MVSELSEQFLAYNSAADFHVPSLWNQASDTIQILKASVKHKAGFAVTSGIIWELQFCSR